MRNKQIICKSGMPGWQGKLQDQYKSFEEFERYSSTYNLHVRLGYKTPRSAWITNPTVQGSVTPSDFRKVTSRTVVIYSTRSSRKKGNVMIRFRRNA